MFFFKYFDFGKEVLIRLREEFKIRVLEFGSYRRGAFDSNLRNFEEGYRIFWLGVLMIEWDGW